MNKQRIGLFGATSLVGECLLQQLTQEDHPVTIFSRSPDSQKLMSNCSKIVWHQLQSNVQVDASIPYEKIALWVSLAPIWTLPEYFNRLLAHGIQRIVVLSSTSRFTKERSSNPGEQATVQRLIEGERRLRIWAVNNNVEWIILRPTLIYGLGRDKNVAEIAHFIHRFGFFPLLGPAKGLRQPVHAKDVATACFSALMTVETANHSYNLSGGETLSYREMVKRILIALEDEGLLKFSFVSRKLRLVTVPRWLFQLAIIGLRWLPRYQHWTTAMADRMNNDLVFDCSEAKETFGFSPRKFNLDSTDLPKNSQ